MWIAEMQIQGGFRYAINQHGERYKFHTKWEKAWQNGGFFHRPQLPREKRVVYFAGLFLNTEVLCLR